MSETVERLGGEHALGRRGRQVSIAATVALFLITLLLTRQSQVPAIAGLAAPLALAFVLSRLQVQAASTSLMPVLFFCTSSGLISLFAEREPSDVIRFFVITLGTLLAFHIRPARLALGWALLPVALQAALIVIISVSLSLAQDPELAGLLRGLVQGSQWGDVYSHDGLYYRVQLVGNALLPLLFMVCLWRRRVSRLYRSLAVLALLALFAAGNLTYVLVAVLALAVHFRRWLLATTARTITCLVIAAVLLGTAWSAIADAFSTKFDGADSSMGVRFDQLQAAYEDLGDSPAKLLFGAGLGARFPDGRERKYSEFQYIELQSLYLAFQLGSIGTLLYLATLLYCSRRFLDREGQTILWLFLLAGSTNPYILDSNQIVATAVLVCLFPRRDRRRVARNPTPNFRPVRG
jgi:hypothetical protein